MTHDGSRLSLWSGLIGATPHFDFSGRLPPATADQAVPSPKQVVAGHLFSTPFYVER